MKFEIEELVELGIMIVSFILLTVYFRNNYLLIIQQFLIWTFATSGTLLVVARVKKYLITYLEKHRK